MSDKWADYKEKFCGCKDASRLNSCKGLANCSLPSNHPERNAPAVIEKTMTNNPTIDGVLVPRELLERLNNLTRWHFGNEAECVELRALLDVPASDLREHCKQCAEVVKTWPEWKRDCLGGAPIVERQPDPIIGVLKANLAEGVNPSFSGGDLKHLCNLLWRAIWIASLSCIVDR